MKDSATKDSPPGDDTSAAARLDASILRRLRQAIALALWRHGAVRVAPEGEPFRLASGNFSPVYVNCRQVISDPSFLRIFTAASGLLLADAEVDAVAGGETAGIPYAAVLAQALGRPLLYLRKKPKGHGIASRVEGTLRRGWRVLLVEDLITDGGSKLGFLDAVEAAGGTVHDALVLFDRQQGGRDLLAGRDVELHAVSDRATAMEVAATEGLLDAAALESVRSYFADSAAWHGERGLEYRG